MPPAHLPSDPSVTVWGRPGCHLCADAEQVVAEVCAALGVTWVKRSILDDEARRTAYRELIPVIEVDGEVIATWRIEADEVRRALRR